LFAAVAVTTRLGAVESVVVTGKGTMEVGSATAVIYHHPPWLIFSFDQ
jgi:hypothetical protein